MVNLDELGEICDRMNFVLLCVCVHGANRVILFAILQNWDKSNKLCPYYIYIFSWNLILGEMETFGW